jgi:hypothetical protein
MTEIDEMQEALRLLQAKLPKGAKGNSGFFIAVHPDWIQPIFQISPSDFVKSQGATWREMIASAEADWESRKANVETKTIRALALAIIRLTYDLGECTDAALRAEFHAADVERYGAEAVATANGMAEGAPFSISVLAGANDEAA